MEDKTIELQVQPSNIEPMDIDDPDEVINEPADIIPEAHTSSMTIKLSYLLYKERQSGDPLARPHFFKITPTESVRDWTGNISEASFEEFKKTLFAHVTTSRKIRRILDMGNCSGRLYFYVSAHLGQPLGVFCPLHGIHFCSFASFVAEAMRQPERPITIIMSMRHVVRHCVADGTEVAAHFSGGSFFVLSERNKCPGREYQFHTDRQGFRLQPHLVPSRIKPEIGPLGFVEELLLFCGIPQNDRLTHGLIDLHQIDDWRFFVGRSCEELEDLGFGTRTIQLLADGVPLYIVHLNDTLFDTSDEDEFIDYDDEF
ncbi:hypothetical protein PGT21_021194 [Puccinia graminis f. sp. tritici]|uniref:Uncharacterized protein n=1 Tax=Puccinia graminis f. sp. tritici TaxID=56615 RepID=A0A5B0LZ21_PUCGR|nr:hypothetical protein PGT21_021194 [Puccinia graminis f. sp. tritici]